MEIKMLKVVVFDGGYGGQVVAKYLAEELSVVEVKCVIDKKHGLYDTKSFTQVCLRVEKNLRIYIGKVDLIVLGGYTVSLAVEYLRELYPNQKFVSVGINYYRILKSSNYPTRITVMMNEPLIESSLCEELKENLPYSTLAVPDCSGWNQLAGAGQLSSEVIRTDLGTYFELYQPQPIKLSPIPSKSESLLATIIKEKYYPSVTEAERRLIPSDVVLVLNTCLWNVTAKLEEVFGYKVRVLDFRQKLLHDTCISLNLLGADGERSK